MSMIQMILVVMTIKKDIEIGENILLREVIVVKNNLLIKKLGMSVILIGKIEKT